MLLNREIVADITLAFGHIGAHVAEACSESRVLVVDLDGTLVHTDLLFETFWSSFARNWRTPIIAIRALSVGRAALKKALSHAGAPDATALPYNKDVIAYMEAWRSNGGRVALVTASDERLAEQVAAHVGGFDEVHGSRRGLNLKGANKSRFLVERYGRCGYAYIGDSVSDLPAWERASKAITVDAPRTLKRRVEQLSCDVEHLTCQVRPISDYVRALRPHQWLKNTLVFVPMLAAQQFTAATALYSLLAFIAFSLIASSVYIVNDLLDLCADRAHPRKRQRPFASGAIPIGHGTWMAPALLVLGFAVALSLGWAFVFLMAAYFAATMVYSLHLKRCMIVDICMLAGLYTMRIAAGGEAAGIPLSIWLLAFAIFFFFALAAVKRQAELVDSALRGEVMASGRGYQVGDLPFVAQIATASGYVSVLVMAMYLNSAAVQEFYSQPAVLWGICLVLIYWISRIVLVTHRGGMDDDPIIYAVRDPASLTCFVLIIGFVLGGALL